MVIVPTPELIPFQLFIQHACTLTICAQENLDACAHPIVWFLNFMRDSLTDLVRNVRPMLQGSCKGSKCLLPVSFIVTSKFI